MHESERVYAASLRKTPSQTNKTTAARMYSLSMAHTLPVFRLIRLPPPLLSVVHVSTLL